VDLNISKKNFTYLLSFLSMLFPLPEHFYAFNFSYVLKANF